ncbi:MAG: FecR family protein, partial [Tannerella sp.]|nr:FecR family protein [Tannerella sp.]
MDERLNRYFSQLLSEKEKQKLFDELGQDEALKKDFVNQRNMLSVIALLERKGDNAYAQRKYRQFREKIHTIFVRKIAIQVVKYAAVVALTTGAWALYQHAAGKQTEEVVACTKVEVPAGQRAHISLPDGTGVWLNAGTTL